MANTHWQCLQHHYHLQRLPEKHHHSLQAWDSVDDYLVAQLEQQPQLQRLLIVGDRFGALAVALHQRQLTLLTDSYTSQQATVLNYQHNQLAADKLNFLPATEVVSHELPVDAIVLRVGKQLSSLHYQLAQISPLLRQGTQLWIAGRQQEITKAHLTAINQLVGQLEVLPTVRKARLYHLCLTQDIAAIELPNASQYPWPDSPWLLSQAGNVFASSHADPGALVMAQHLPQLTGEVIDLGCGNGILALLALSQSPQAQLLLTDESYAAVASARRNIAQLGDEALARARFQVDFCLSQQSDSSADTVLCNPPFHQDSTLTTDIAYQMFADSARVLRDDGQLLVVANRHLNYHQSLKRWFKQVQILSQHPKFVILRASAPIR